MSSIETENTRNEVIQLFSGSTNTVVITDRRRMSVSARLKSLFPSILLATSLGIGFGPKIATAVSEGVNFYQTLQQNSDNWSDANLSSKAFLAKYENQLIEETNIGATFIPEEEGASLSNMNTKFGRAAYNKAEQTLDYMHNVLNINEITLGIREDNFVNKKGKYNFKYYEQFLDKIFKYKMRVNLILGVKTPGWDEQHAAPQDEPELLQIAATGGVVYADSKLAQDDLRDQTAFFKNLVANYSKEDLNLINSLEFQNEFSNKFGNKQEQVIFDKGVLVEDARNSKQFLPGKRIIVSSAGPLNIDPDINAIKALKADDPNVKVGINIHDYSVDAGDFSFPFVGEVNRLDTPLGRFSPLIYDKMALNELEKVAKFCNQTTGCTEMVGEAEGKAWDGSVGLPGNKVADFHYELLNSMQILDAGGKTTQTKYIGYWGICDLVDNKDNPDNKIIINELRTINAKNVKQPESGNGQSGNKIPKNLIRLVYTAPLRRAA